MAGYNKNQIFKELATRYVEYYGEMLNDEAALLNRQPVVTPRMDSNVRRYIKSGGTRRYAAGLAALAAMVAIVLMIPMLNNLNNSGMMSPESSAAAPSPAQAESAAPAPAQDAQSSPTPEILPLSFTLPDNLTVADSKLDNGKSVYYLSNSGRDDIVMTMELDPKEDVFAGLRQTQINDYTVYYKYTADYSVMAFKKQDITYVLTCKHDVNTLVPLAEAIL